MGVIHASCTFLSWGWNWICARYLVFYESSSTHTRRLNNTGTESPAGTKCRILPRIPSHECGSVLRNLSSQLCLTYSMSLHLYFVEGKTGLLTNLFSAELGILTSTTLSGGGRMDACWFELQPLSIQLLLIETLRVFDVTIAEYSSRFGDDLLGVSH